MLRSSTPKLLKKVENVEVVGSKFIMFFHPAAEGDPAYHVLIIKAQL